MTIPRGDDLFPEFGLMPDVVWGVVPLPEARSKISILNEAPPEHVRHLHDPWFFRLLWDRLLERIRRLVRVHEGDDGHRVVEVLGDMVIERATDGQLTVRVWECERIGRPALVEMPAHKVVLVGMPWRWLWLRAMAKNASVEVRHWAIHRISGQRQEVTMAMATDYTAWAFGIYEREIRRHCDLRVMRRRIAQALKLDPWAVNVAARLVRPSPGTDAVMVSAYNLVLRHRVAFETLRCEAPHLVALFGALCEHSYFPREGEPTARLKHYVCDWLQGYGRVWRLLAHGNARALQPVRDLYKGPVGDAVRDYLRVLSWLGFDEQPPAWLIRQVLNLWGTTENRQEGYWRHIFGSHRQGGYWHVVQAFLRHHGRVERPNEAVVNELENVLRWALESRELGQLDTPRRKAGWPWLLRRAGNWKAEREHALRLDPRPWEVPFQSVHRKGFTAHVLSDELALWEEARAMRHCAYSLVDECRQGETMVLSIRRDERRLCTLAIIRERGRWEFWQAQGKANASVSPALKASLMELVDQVNRWELHDRLRRRMARR